jgi:NarL family two-component system sensor histidine kinase LiaS
MTPFRFFRRLRGKMALTYTLVTGGVFLLLWLGLVGLILSLEGVPAGSPLTPTIFNGVVRDIQPYIEEGDSEGLQTYLDLWVSGDRLEIRNEAGTFVASYQSLYYVAVADAQGTIIAVEPQALPLGEPLRNHMPPGVLNDYIGQPLTGVPAPYRGEEALYNIVPAADGATLVLVFGPDATDTDLQEELGAVTVGFSMTLLCGASLMGALFGLLASRGLLRRLRHLGQTVRTWAAGDLSPVVRDTTDDELGELAQDLNRMARQLDDLMATRSAWAAVEERNRLARDLHDTVKQQIFAASMQLASARTLIHEQPAAADAILERVEALIDSVQSELSGLILALRPPALADQGLAAALHSYANAWAERTGISTKVLTQGERRAPLPVAQALYRVMQEALANVEKHANATQVIVKVSWQAHTLTLDIIDNGRGFDASQPTEGFGLQSMNDRAERLNGLVTVDSQPGRGTRITTIVEISHEQN